MTLELWGSWNYLNYDVILKADRNVEGAFNIAALSAVEDDVSWGRCERSVAVNWFIHAFESGS